MSFNRNGDPKVCSSSNLVPSGNIGGRSVFENHPLLDGSGDSLNLNWECKNYEDCMREISQMMSQSHDVCDMLPSDPFDMTMIMMEEADEGSVDRAKKDETEVKKAGDDQLFLEVMNRLFSDMIIHGKSVGDEVGGYSVDGRCGDSILLHGIKDYGYGKNGAMVSSDEGNEVCDDVVGSPPDALFFALSYLGVKDLLNVERVCVSLRDGVRNDPLLWRRIRIEDPLCLKLSDEALLKLTDRANGSLQSLSLFNCFKISDIGLKTVLQRNPGLTKLSVTGCSRISVGDLIGNLKALKSAGGAGIQSLRIAGMHGITMDYFEEIKKLLCVDKQKQRGPYKPQLFSGPHSFLSFDDERVLDIEVCPKCDQPRRVYDCSAESCRGKRHACRGCTVCIARCIGCGCCFNERRFQETFCLNFLCMDCCQGTQFWPREAVTIIVSVG